MAGENKAGEGKMGEGMFDPEILKTFKFFGTIGFNLAGSMILGFYLGRLADQRLGTSPWLAIAGFLMGAVAGFIGVYKLVMPEFKERKRRNEDE